MGALPNPTKINESKQLNKLARYIAGHLLRLAFDSSNNLGVGLDNILDSGGVRHEYTDSSSSVYGLHDSWKDYLIVLSLKFELPPTLRI